MLAFAEDPRTDAEAAFEKLLPHEGEPLGCQDKSGMDETIDVSCLLVDCEISR